jgi:hypothetical protein
MLYVPVVIVVVAVAVLIGVIAVAMGRGGELGYFQPDYAPLNLEEVSATDVALFRPPTALWGYGMQATDEALDRIAGAITERDIEIATLRQRVADLEASAGGQRAPGEAGPPGRRPQDWGPEPPDWGPPSDPRRWDTPPGPRDDQTTAERDEIFLPSGGPHGPGDVESRSVWEPPPPARGQSETGWAALPKQPPNSAAPDDADDR